MAERMNGDDMVPDGDLRVAILWDDVGCPNAGGHEEKPRTAVGELEHFVSYWWSMTTTHISCSVMELWGFKVIGVTTLTFWGYLTLSVTLPLDPLTNLDYPTLEPNPKWIQ